MCLKDGIRVRDRTLILPHRRRSVANVRDDYFTAIADDLTGEEAQAQIKELRKLCDSVIEAP